MRFTKENTPYIIFGAPALAFILYVAGGVALMGSGEINQAGNSNPQEPAPTPTALSTEQGFGAALTPTVTAAILDQARRDTQGTESKAEVAPREVSHVIQKGETLYDLVPLLVNSHGLRLPVKVSIGSTVVILPDLSGSLSLLTNDYQIDHLLLIKSEDSSTQSEPSVVVPYTQPAAGQESQSSPAAEVLTGGSTCPNKIGWYYVKLQIGDNPDETQTKRIRCEIDANGKYYWKIVNPERVKSHSTEPF